MQKIKLAYIGKMIGFEKVYDARLWNVLEPRLPAYQYKDGSYNVPTLGISGLAEMGLIDKKFVK